MKFFLLHMTGTRDCLFKTLPTGVCSFPSLSVPETENFWKGWTGNYKFMTALSPPTSLHQHNTPVYIKETWHYTSRPVFALPGLQQPRFPSPRCMSGPKPSNRLPCATVAPDVRHLNGIWCHMGYQKRWRTELLSIRPPPFKPRRFGKSDTCHAQSGPGIGQPLYHLSGSWQNW